MELQVKKIDFPQFIEFNYAELEAEITAKAEIYKNMIYTDDTIKEAKADKAALNKFITALEAERKNVKKQCLQPYEEFEKKIKALVAIVDEPVQLIDTQVKAYEDRLKDEKLEKIKEFWDNTEHPEWLQCNQIFDQKWLNATVSLKKVQEAITDRLAQIESDTRTIATLPTFKFEAMEEYKSTLDLNRAITEGQRLADIQIRKQEAENAIKQADEEIQQEGETVIDVEPEVEEAPMVESKESDKQWFKFEALLSVEDATALGEFCKQSNIQLRAIK